MLCKFLVSLEFVVCLCAWLAIYQIYRPWKINILYIIMENSLSKRLEIERTEGRIEGIHIFRNVKALNHSQFGDDTLMMVWASRIIEKYLKLCWISF